MTPAASPLVEIEVIRDVLHHGRHFEAGTIIVLSEERARPMLENGWARRTKPPRPPAFPFMTEARR